MSNRSFNLRGSIQRIGLVDGAYAVEFVVQNAVLTYYLDIRSFRQFATYVGFTSNDPAPQQIVELTIEDDWIIGWR